MFIISVAGNQVVKNLSEPSEITLFHLDIYADYLKEKDPQTGLQGSASAAHNGRVRG